ncbi:MAG: hypothetical protein DRP84_04865 [Spirochaetes bacterium]|nr:MAG: hypothetical protein DRP84_04865 [Spirochaetota bacterium]
MIIRIIFVLISVGIAILVSFATYRWENPYIYPVIVFLATSAIVTTEYFIKRFQKENVAKIFKGVILGLILGVLFLIAAYTLRLRVDLFYGSIIYLITLYFGITVLSQLNFGGGFIATPPAPGFQTESLKILDTSVIIDGRIADLIDTKFIEGVLIVPKFVLEELQQIADSEDSIKRIRGRRGLDVLNRLKKDKNTLIRITDQDFPEIAEVDSKLIKLAKTLNAKIITNDFNLYKVAEIQGITVLNINQLANALKPVVLPGEKMKLVVVKEGKDPGQGIGYLDDGTMIVIDNGKKYVGDEVFVTVTSVLQTPAGRMIFAKVDHE